MITMNCSRTFQVQGGCEIIRASAKGSGSWKFNPVHSPNCVFGVRYLFKICLKVASGLVEAQSLSMRFLTSYFWLSSLVLTLYIKSHSGKLYTIWCSSSGVLGTRLMELLLNVYVFHFKLKPCSDGPCLPDTENCHAHLPVLHQGTFTLITFLSQSAQ